MRLGVRTTKLNESLPCKVNSLKQQNQTKQLNRRKLVIHIHAKHIIRIQESEIDKYVVDCAEGVRKYSQFLKYRNVYMT